MKPLRKHGFALLLCLVMVLGLAACGGSENQTTAPAEEKPTEAAEKTTAAETAETQTTAPETEAETKGMTAEEKRAAILAAAKAPAAEDDLQRVKEILSAAGADLSAVATAQELLRSEQLALLSGIAVEAPESLVEMFDWMTKAWDGGYVKLTSDLITAEQKAERLALYNDYSSTQTIVQNYNTPQQVLRAYVQAQPGDLLLGVNAVKEGKLKLAQVIAGVTVSYLADGINVNPKESSFRLIDEKGQETELSFQQAFIKYYALPYRLAELDDAAQPAAPAAQTAELPKAPVFKVGFGRADITSDLSIPLAGYGNTTSRMSNTTLTPEDRLTTTAIALSDGTNTEILYTMDTIRVPTYWSDKAAAAVEKATGVGQAHISFSCTHTHSGPDIGDEESADQAAKALTSQSPYYKVWEQAMVQAAVDAMADLSEVAETKVAVTAAEDLNYIRHWRASSGLMEGTNFSKTSNLGVAEIADEDMQLIRFVREGRQDVVLVNWQAHNNAASTGTTSYGSKNKPYISADYAGFMRRYLEQKDEDCLAAYFLGASGNVLPRASETEQKKHNIDAADELGEMLALYAIAAMDKMTTVETGAVQGMQENHIAFDDGYVGTVREIEQNVITVGKSLAFVTAGYEMFNVNGEDTKERSPFAITFVCTCGQGHEYMPSFQAHHYGILGADQQTPYEVKAAQCNVVPGTAEDLVDGLIGMLDQLWANLGLSDKDIDKTVAKAPQHFDRAELLANAKEAEISESGNLALAATVTTTYAFVNKASFPLSMINDGKHAVDGTNMAALKFKEGGEILFDLGKNYQVTGYNIWNYEWWKTYGLVTGWEVYASTDGASYTKVGSGSIDTSAVGTLKYASDFMGGKPDGETFAAPVTARYIKLVVTSCHKDTKNTDAANIRLYEVDILGHE